MADRVKMIEMALDNSGFGLEPKISEVDYLVIEDDNLLVSDLERKDSRAIRIQKTKNKKLRLEKLYNPSSVRRYAHRACYDKDCTGVTPVFHGEDSPVAFIKKAKKNITKQTFNKVMNRKVRYQKIDILDIPEEILEEDTFNLVEEEDWTWWYQSLPLGESIGEKVWEAWYDYGLWHVNECVAEFDNIAKSLQRLSNLNRTLQSYKLEDNIDALFECLRQNHKF